MHLPTTRQTASFAAVITVVSAPVATVTYGAASGQRPSVALVRVHEDRAQQSVGNVTSLIRITVVDSRASGMQASSFDPDSWISHMGANPADAQPLQPVSC